jgi:hypothetical protein
MKNVFKLTFSAAFLLSACAGDPPSQTAEVVQIARPKSQAKRIDTGMNEALRCFGRMLADNKVRPFSVMSSGLPDKTGKIYTTAQEGTFAGPATKDMMVTAISTISAESQAVYFIEWGQVTPEGVTSNVKGLGSIVPDYFITGGITQVDDGIADKTTSVGADISTGNVGIGGSYSKDFNVGLVTIDMSIGKLPERYMIPGLSVSNTIALSNKGTAIGAEATVSKFGISYDVSDRRKNGVQQTVRALIELGLIETIGRKEGLPYWQCLDLDSTRPAVVQEMQKSYSSMKLPKRVTFVQRKLKQAGYYSGEVNGRNDATTRLAIQRYKSKNNQVPTSDVDFNLYVALSSQKFEAPLNQARVNPTVAAAATFKRLSAPDRAEPEQKQSALPASTAAPGKTASAKTPQRKISLTARATNSIYRKGDKIALKVKLSDTGYLHCYYKDSVGNISRVFPNRFARDARVAGGKEVQIPSTGMGFSIVADVEQSSQSFRCFAARANLDGKLANGRLKTDLVPLKMTDLSELSGLYSASEKSKVAEKLVTVSIQ